MSDPFRVVFYDARYPSAWVTTPERLAQDLLLRASFHILNADELAGWMKRRTLEGAADAVCVLAHGIAPDTIYEGLGTCTALKYLKAGGRLVWVGDVPFYYRGKPDGTQAVVGDGMSAHHEVLGCGVHWNQSGTPSLTAEGKAWGMTQADEAARPVNLGDVAIAFTKLGKFACSYLRRLGSGEFLRYRGGAFPGPDWNAGVSDLLNLSTHGLKAPADEAAADLSLSADPEQLKIKRVVFHDPQYDHIWVKSPKEVAQRLEARGFSAVGAEDLAAWMESHAAAGADGSVCVLAQGIAPDTVAESPSHSCLLRQYMEAGGRVVWIGDVPFHQQGRAGGRLETWGGPGNEGVLGLSFVPDKPKSKLLEAGKAWGLKTPDGHCWHVDAKQVTVALTESEGWAGSFFKNYNPSFPMSGFVHVKGRFDDLAACDELAAAAVHGLTPAAEHPAAAAAAAKPRGTQVSGGSFIVDREAALDKMMRFQLSKPQQYLLPWLRLAAASGARQASIVTTAKTVALSFDGAPLPACVFDDPYAGIFGEVPAQDVPAARQLALGLLSALRLDPARIVLRSGPRGAVRGLEIRGLHDRSPVTPAGSSGTVLTVDWRKAPGTERHAAEAAAAHDGNRVRLRIDHETVKRPSSSAGLGERLELGTNVYGRIQVPSEARPVSNLDVYAYGVRVGAVQVRLPLVQIEGWINDDAFRLSASQSSVVKDRRFWRTMRRLSAEAEKLLLETAKEHAARMPQTAKLIATDGCGRAGARARFGTALAKHWKRRLEDPRVERSGALAGPMNPGWRRVLAATGGGADRRKRAVREVWREARVSLWLRDATARLLPNANDPDADGTDPVKRALWEAPVLVTPDGRSASLLSLERQRRLIGYVPIYKDSISIDNTILIDYPVVKAPPPFETAWCLAAQDLPFLNRRFGSAVVDVTRQLEAFSERKAKARGKTELPSVRLAVQSVGGGRRLLREGPWKGELALNQDLSAPSRVYFFRKGEPAGFHDLKTELRVTAALELPEGKTLGPGGEEIARVEETVLREARALHAKLGALVRRSPHNLWRYRDHLVRFLVEAAERAKGGALAPEDRWAEELPVLRFQLRNQYDRRLSSRLLREAAGKGWPFLIHSTRRGSWPDIRDLPLLSGSVPNADIARFVAAMLPGAVIVPFRDTVFDLVYRKPAGLGSWEALAKEKGRELELIEAVIHGPGTLVGEPDNPARKALLAALGAAMSAWPGRPRDGRRRRLAALVRLLPMFRARHGPPTALRELAVQEKKASELEPQLSLAPHEREALYRLFPEDAVAQEAAAALRPQARELVARAQSILSELRAGAPPRAEEAAAFVSRRPELVELLASELPDDVKTAYLASVLATRMNRASLALDDPEDARFQMWLADRVSV